MRIARVPKPGGVALQRAAHSDKVLNYFSIVVRYFVTIGAALDAVTLRMIHVEHQLSCKCPVF